MRLLSMVFSSALLLSGCWTADFPVDGGSQRQCDDSTNDDVELLIQRSEQAAYDLAQNHDTCTVDDDCSLIQFFDVDCPGGGRNTVCNVAHATAEADAFNVAWQDILDEQCTSWPACLTAAECDNKTVRCVTGTCQAVDDTPAPVDAGQDEARGSE